MGKATEDTVHKEWGGLRARAGPGQWEEFTQEVEDLRLASDPAPQGLDSPASTAPLPTLVLLGWSVGWDRLTKAFL